jgi:HAD superfamily hydrolase (TIGR01509 family)
MDMATSNDRYDAVTLDMGFTLVDLDSGYDRTLLAMARTAGHAFTLDDIHTAQRVFWQEFDTESITRTWEPTPVNDDAIGQEIDRRICEKLGITDAVFLAELRLQARRAFHDPTTYTVFPEVFETLKALRQAVPRLGILSNWGWYLPELCEQLGLAPYLDFIVVSARVGCSKPNPCIFREMLRQAGTTPERTLHVGDSLSADVRGAQALGITGVLVDRAGTVQPDGYLVVRDLAGVLTLL